MIAWYSSCRASATANCPRRYRREDIERACERVLTLSQPSHQALKRTLEHHAAEEEQARATAGAPELLKSGSHVRAIEEYREFFERHAAAPTNDL